MGIVIKAVTDGFRRGGIAHRAKGTYYPDGHFTEEELEQFRLEPQLVVIEQAEFQQPSDHADLLREMGDTIAGLEHELEQARTGLSAASLDVVRLLEYQKAAPSLILDAIRALEPADPASEGVIFITSDGLAAILSNHLDPEAHNDGSKTLDNSGSPDTPSDSAPVPPVPAAPGADAALKTEKAKRGSGKNGGGE